MGALANIWNSERGIVAVALIIAATVLTALGHMTIGAWQDHSVEVFGLYAGSKTITGAVSLWTNRAPSTSTTTAVVATPAGTVESATATTTGTGG